MHADPRGDESVRRRTTEGLFGVHPACFILFLFSNVGFLFWRF